MSKQILDYALPVAAPREPLKVKSLFKAEVYVNATKHQSELEAFRVKYAKRDWKVILYREIDNISLAVDSSQNIISDGMHKLGVGDPTAKVIPMQQMVAIFDLKGVEDMERYIQEYDPDRIKNIKEAHAKVVADKELVAAWKMLKAMDQSLRRTKKFVKSK